MVKIRIKLNSLVLAVIPLLFCAAIVKGQNVHAVDSLSFYLNNIESSADSVNISQANEWLFKSTEDVLLKEYVINEIEQLKSKLNEREYYDLVRYYVNSLAGNNTIASAEKAIVIGQQWLAKNENSKSKYGHYTYLSILRLLRIPFRNLGKLNEAIDYYSENEKKYLAANDSDAVSVTYNVISDSYSRLGLIEKAKYYQLKSISYLNNSQNNKTPLSSMGALFGLSGKINRYAVLGSYYITEKKPAIAEGFLNEAIALYHQLDSPMLMLDAPYLFLQMARCKTLEKNANSASFYDTALKYMDLYQEWPEGYAHYYQEKAADFLSKNLLDSSLNNINKAVKLKDSFKLGILSWYGELLTGFSKASILIKKGNAKSAIPLLQGEIKEIKILNNNSLLIDELSLLAKAYSANGDTKEAYKTLMEAFLLKNKLVSEQNDARSLNFEMEKKMQENEITIGILDAQNKAIQKTKYYLISIVSLLALFVLGLGVFYSNKRKSNRELALKNESLAYTIQQLKSTQAQLIQSEKMASLGELTAGIAHEIQNPLNFVNNFSELNNELIKELKNELDVGNTIEVKEIANDIAQNSEKINHHGKRAESIVKGMLEHSRKSSGVKEPTDINKLCDEFVRLSYHGLRAKDPKFNCDYKLDLDPNLPMVNVVSQDIGRVLLNIINNAFQACAEKSGSLKLAIQKDYKPLVVLSTKFAPVGTSASSSLSHRDTCEIIISDNGLGIPDSIKDKIFQPFFTTKPTGQGTGLGLSLAYDIIKAHGGNIMVHTKPAQAGTDGENVGSEFTIQIPIL